MLPSVFFFFIHFSIEFLFRFIDAILLESFLARFWLHWILISCYCVCYAGGFFSFFFWFGFTFSIFYHFFLGFGFVFFFKLIFFYAPAVDRCGYQQYAGTKKKMASQQQQVPAAARERPKEREKKRNEKRKKERKRGRKKVDRFFSDRLDTQPLATANESSVIFLRPVKKRKRRLLGR